ncbi:MAG: MtrB/PioB family decaheme-associated outer membrane protein [Gammaproteobacteria bacterium]
MMNIRRNALSLMVSTAVLATAASVGVQADEHADEANMPDMSKWECKRCPEYYGWWGEALLGIGWVSDDSLRFGSYRGLEDDGFYAAIDGNATYRDAEGMYLDVMADDLGIDSRRLDMRGGRMGSYEIRFGWQEIPFYRGYSAATPYAGQGGTVLTLPANWVPAAGTSGMTELAGALQPAPLGVKRDILDAGLTWRATSNWSFDVDAQRQEKTGTRPWGGGGLYFNSAAVLPAPVDYTTDRIDAGVNWTGSRASLRLGFMGSWFDNGANSMAWDHAFSGTPETTRFQAALEPDNEYYQFSLSGAYRLTDRINFSGHAAMGEGTQDEAFLPYSVNPDFGGLVLPRASLDGQVDTSIFNVGGKLTARVNSKLSLTARYKYDERDNQTPVDLWTPVVADFIQNEERFNRPYGFERTQYSLDARFRFTSRFRLAAGAKQLELDRTLQAVEESDDTTFWTEATWTGLPLTQIRLKLEATERDISEYRANDSGPGPVDHPLFRKYNQADRERTRVILDASVMATDRLTLNLNAANAVDDYTDSPLGLQNSNVESFNLSLDYAASETMTFYAFAGYETIESSLDGSASLSSLDRWFADTRDRIMTGGVGGNWFLSETGNLGVDLLASDTRGNIDVRTSADEDPFPALRTELVNLRLHWNQKIGENWGYRLLAEYENFEATDWGIDGYGADGIDPLLWIGISSPKYSIWHFRAQATYRF